MKSKPKIMYWKRAGYALLVILAFLLGASHPVQSLAAQARKTDEQLFKLATDAENTGRKGAGYDSAWVEALGYLTAYVERAPVALNNQQKYSQVTDHLDLLKNYVEYNNYLGMSLARDRQKVEGCLTQAGWRGTFSVPPRQPGPLPPIEGSGSAAPSGGGSSNTIREPASLFFDDFSGPRLNGAYQAWLPDARYRNNAPDLAYYQGAPNYSFQNLNGASVIRVGQNLNNQQRRGWSTYAVFPTQGQLRLELRFNTLVQSPKTGIDQLLEVWLFDPNNASRQDRATLFSYGYGANRLFYGGSTIQNSGQDKPFNFADNTWYRLVITGSQSQNVRAAIYADDGQTELVGVDLGHPLNSYSNGFRLGLSQSVGFPQGSYPTDVAIDWISLSKS